jgi:hypothetical protein
MVHGKCQKNLKYTKVMLNPESVILNLVQNLFRAGLVKHLIKPINQTLKQVQGDIHLTLGF